VSCSVCYERGYYLITSDDEHEIVRCDCQVTRDEEIICPWCMDNKKSCRACDDGSDDSDK
jgi:hypothetical protein